ncbi:MAG: DUF459 domain-containing protein [Acidimicrobiales bacterium]
MTHAHTRSRRRGPSSTAAGPPPPTASSPRHRGPVSDPTTARSVLATVIVALAVALALSSHRLVLGVERQPIGPVRSAVLLVVEAVDDRAAELGLDHPARALDGILGREAGPDGAADPGPAPGEPLGPPGPRAELALGPVATSPAPAALGPPATLGPPAPGSFPPDPSTTTVPASATGGDTAAAPDPGPPVTAPPEIGRAVSADRPLRLWAGGDSLGEYIGNQLLHPLADPGLSTVELDYHISTGLARPDYFDWPGRFRQAMERTEPPEAAVFMAGGNDDQAMHRPDGGIVGLGSPEWRDEYRRRVAEIMDAADTGETQLYWIGLPPMRDERRHGAAVVVNELLAAEADARPWVTYVPIDALFAGVDGGFTSHIADGDGRQRLVRAPDGVHITFGGSTWVAEDVWARLVERWSIGTGPTPHQPQE